MTQPATGIGATVLQVFHNPIKKISVLLFVSVVAQQLEVLNVISQLSIVHVTSPVVRSTFCHTFTHHYLDICPSVKFVIVSDCHEGMCSTFVFCFRSHGPTVTKHRLEMEIVHWIPVN